MIKNKLSISNLWIVYLCVGLSMISVGFGAVLVTSIFEFLGVTLGGLLFVLASIVEYNKRKKNNSLSK